ncbi:ribonuclease HII [Aquisalibacillus elongatus]|uniref:Ribonuclease HII n=1 Tax=Aquisalibacillus elongatus TaxID=485577 RepID=A0A3N5C8X2_9BACI|nr:ribonuclease HII [Aquisalibacillus elongatus]RPF56012.1 RNase HII [Aquisalibacillus elongatus]
MSQKETVTVIKERLQKGEFTNGWFEQLKQDSRKGVQQLINRFEKQKQKEQEVHDDFLRMSQIEQQLYNNGYQYIAGVDEVGRGPLAGPVVTASVILPKDIYLPGLNDSKKLSLEQREYFYNRIKENAIAIGVGQADAQEIDYLNIYQATKLAMKRSIDGMAKQPDYLLIDAMRLDQVDVEQQSIVKGDSKSISIAAASVVAKVERDRLMEEIAKDYPMYQFESNVGYGTKAHLDSLKEYGPTPYHRRSFQPVRQYT